MSLQDVLIVFVCADFPSVVGRYQIPRGYIMFSNPAYSHWRYRMLVGARRAFFSPAHLLCFLTLECTGVLTYMGSHPNVPLWKCFVWISDKYMDIFYFLQSLGKWGAKAGTCDHGFLETWTEQLSLLIWNASVPGRVKSALVWMSCYSIQFSLLLFAASFFFLNQCRLL